MLLKAKSFILAVWSFVRWGDAPIELYEDRKRICEECPELVPTPTGKFCGKCECPRWPISDLRSKWRMLDLRCPLNNW
jgi:hypothetical protein